LHKEIGFNSLRLLIVNADENHSCVVLGTLRPYSLNLIAAYYFIWQKGKRDLHPMEISCVFLEQPLQAQVHTFYNLIKPYFVTACEASRVRGV
jgi:hypothetical protein